MLHINRRRCVGLAADGTQCKRNAAAGSQLCDFHMKELERMQPPAAKRRAGSSQWHRYVLRNYPELVGEMGRGVTQGTKIWLDNGYTVIGLLGSGSFGVVFAVEYKNTKYALKISTDEVTEQDMCLEADMQRRVAAILPETPKVFACDKFYYEEKVLARDGSYYKDEMHMFTTMEMMEGDCTTLIMEFDGMVKRMAEEYPLHIEVGLRFAFIITAVTLYVYREMARQLAILEAHGIYHVDTKPGNMLFSREQDSSGNDIFRLCLSDYGLACDLTEKYKCVPLTTYMPPEWRALHPSTHLTDPDAVRRAQWYIVGSRMKIRFDNMIRQFTIAGGNILEPYVNPIFVDAAWMPNIYSNARKMSQENPADRQNKYDEIVADCESMIRYCASREPLGITTALVNSLKPYVRKP